MARYRSPEEIVEGTAPFLREYLGPGLTRSSAFGAAFGAIMCQAAQPGAEVHTHPVIIAHQVLIATFALQGLVTEWNRPSIPLAKLLPQLVVAEDVPAVLQAIKVFGAQISAIQLEDLELIPPKE